MKNKIKECLLGHNIEYFSILSYSDVRETNSRIIEREGFAPKSVIIYLLPYYAGESLNLSRYAASLDYHLAINEINDSLKTLIKEYFPKSNVKGYGDHSPIDERHAALIAGLGISGSNGLIINEKYGSYIFIGDMITDIEPEFLGASEPVTIRSCERCGVCLAACPTGILRGEGSDCLSAITQRKGELSEEEKQLMRKCNTAWGCDLCQSVCPHNRKPALTPVDFFYRERIDNLTRKLLDSMTDEEFSRRAFAWRKRKTIERNLDILSEK